MQDWVGDDLLRLGSWIYDGIPHRLLRYKDVLWGKLYVETMIRKVLNFNGQIYFSNHHLSHAASAFFASPFDRAALLTIDGVGEYATMTYGLGKDDKLYIYKQINYPDSIGLLYSALTSYLGFSANTSEYKVMGLSAYGSRDRVANSFYRKLRSLVDLCEDGSFRIDMSYFDFYSTRKMVTTKFNRLMGGAGRNSSDVVSQRHMDLAAALQMVTEDAIFAMMRHVARETQEDCLCYSGGVALNSVANGKIHSETPFKSLFIQPAAGDSGSSIGAAYVAYHHILGRKSTEGLSSIYLGPSFSDEQIGFYLDLNDINYHYIPAQDLFLKRVAELIAVDKIIGWFQGRMEWGPRALGARSILANPCNQNMRDIINMKVKHREEFRPFAPVVCTEHAEKFFELVEPSNSATDFMLMVHPVREEFRASLPAVTHVDGTARVQTVSKEQNPLYYGLIREFGRLTGVPMLINTSFNIRGEPIVCTPDDAYRCFTGTAIDALAMGSFLVLRDETERDRWDSKVQAVD